MAHNIENLADSGRTFFDISLNTDQIGIGFEADTHEKMTATCHRMRLSDKDLGKKLLTSNRKIRLLVSNFLNRSLSESRSDGHIVVIFQVYLFHTPCQSDQY